MSLSDSRIIVGARCGARRRRRGGGGAAMSARGGTTCPTTAASTACYSVIVISYNHFLIKRLMGYGLMRQATRFLGSSRNTRQRGAIFVPV